MDLGRSVDHEHAVEHAVWPHGGRSVGRSRPPRYRGSGSHEIAAVMRRYAKTGNRFVEAVRAPFRGLPEVDRGRR